MGLLFADSGSEISSPIFNELTLVGITSIRRNIFTVDIAIFRCRDEPVT